MFRWSVSMIISFAIGMLIIQYQKEKIMRQSNERYQHIVDSLQWELKMQQLYKAK